MSLVQLPMIEIMIYDKEQREVARIINETQSIDISKGFLKVNILHNKIQLSKGFYTMSLLVNEDLFKNPILRMNNIISFQILHKREVWSPFMLEAEMKILIN